MTVPAAQGERVRIGSKIDEEMKGRRTASVVAFRDVEGVQDLVVIWSSKRIRVPRSESEVPFEVRLEAGEGELGEKGGGTVLANDRDEVSEASHLPECRR
jgi:hypothetical protein